MWSRFRSLVFVLGLLGFLTPLSIAQSSSDRINAIQTNLDNAKAAYDQLPDDVKKKVHPDRLLQQLSDVVLGVGPGLANGANANWQPSNGWNEGGADENGLVQVNSPARDFRFSPFIGYTQNSASTARCGQSVVVAFNDSGSLLETLVSGSGGVTVLNNAPPGATGGLSLSGVASSFNGGVTFTDRGAVPPGPDVHTFLMGNPAVACSDPSNFYMVQEGRFASTFGYVSPLHGIALSVSHDGGATWSNPVPAAVTDPANSFFPMADDFQQPRVAVDPTNHNRIYISYVRQQDFTFCSTIFGVSPLTTIEVIVSNDGGQTFDPNPVVVDSQCVEDTFFTDFSPRMAISSGGIVYVAWESAFFDTISKILVPAGIQVASFAPTGRPTVPTTVDFVFPLRGAILGQGPFTTDSVFGFGDGATLEVPYFRENGVYVMQGGFQTTRSGFDLAVDRSGGPTDGNVYVAWADGRNGPLAAPELEDIVFLAYTFTDVFFSSSTDGGQTFSPTQQLNSDLQPLTSRGHDHFRPVLAVDRKGKVAACWYDRRNDPQNYQFERFCAESANAGASWAEFRVNGSLSTPSAGQDWLILRPDMGHNDDLTTDFNGHDPGFLGGIQWMSSGMNPDIKVVKFQ